MVIFQKHGLRVGTVAIALGFVTACSQIVLLREALNFGRGSELTIAAALFLWLAGIGIGAFTFSYLRPISRAPLAIYLLCWACAFLPIVCVAFGRVTAYSLLDPGEAVGVGGLLIASSVLMLPTGIAAGTLFPLIAEVGKGALSGSRIYLLEGAGSAAGGIAFTFLLAGRVGHFAAIALTAPLLVVAAAVAVPATATWRRVVQWVGTAAFCGILLSGAEKIEAATGKIRWIAIAGDLKLLETVETRHQRLDLAAEEDQYSIFADGGLDFTFPDPYGAGRMADVVLLQHHQPRRMLLIGGDPVSPAERSQAHGLEKMEYLQLDPVVMELVQRSLPRKMRQLFCPGCVASYSPVDGRRFVRLAPSAFYDVVWINLPDPLTLLVNRYYTLEFFEQIRRLLRPDGIFVTSLGMDYVSPQASSRRYSAGIIETISRKFEKQLIGLSERVILLASGKHSPLTSDPAELAARAAARKLEPALQVPETFANIFDSKRSEWLRGILEREEAIPNTDLHPISYRLQLLHFVRLTDSGIERERGSITQMALAASWQVQWWMIILPAAATLLLIPLLRRRHHAIQAVPIYSMATTGAAGILMALILLLAFQTFSGVMYKSIGLLYALFMVGMTAGTAIGEKLARRLGPAMADIAVAAVAILTALLLPFSAQAPTPIVSSLTAAAGFATGLSFPLLYQAHRSLRESAGKEGLVTSAGMIDGADHAGAALGALLCGLVLIPSLGLVDTLGVILVYKLSSLFLILGAFPFPWWGPTATGSNKCKWLP